MKIDMAPSVASEFLESPRSNVSGGEHGHFPLGTGIRIELD